MRSKFMAVAALLVALAVVAPACGGDDEPEASGTSDRRETATTDSDSSSSSDDSDGSVPDLSDLANAGDCLEIAATWGSIALAALGGEDEAKAAREQAEELKSTLPKELHDDIEIVADAFAAVAEEGILSSDALDSPKFEKANDAIEKYLEETCGG